jgi:hypothetical protein
VATSGTIKLWWTGEDNSGYEGRIKWSSTSNAATFKSTISFTIQIRRNNDNTAYNHSTYSGWIDFWNDWTGSSKEYEFSKPISMTPDTNGQWKNVYSGTYSVSHSTSSGKAPPILLDGAFSGEPNGVGFYVGRDTKIQLTAIPTGATITSAPNFTDEDSPTLTYSNKAGSSVDSLQACISFDGSTVDIPYRDISETGTSYTFEFTDSERQTLRNATLDGSDTKTVYFVIKTVLNGKTYHTQMAKTLTITNANPELSVFMLDTNPTTSALTGDSLAYVIQGYSTMSYEMSAYGAKGAEIVGYSAVNGGTTLDTASGAFTAPEVGTFTFTATDSRGLSATKEITINKIIIKIKQANIPLYFV